MTSVAPTVRKEAAPPLGFVTLLFTDVERSTARWEEQGERFGEALAIHDRVIREALPRHNGFEVKSRGDGFLLSFASPSDAVRCAVDIQHELEHAESSNPVWQIGRIRARMGIHSGQTTYRDHDYYGSEVNRAARICDAGHGGFILVSDESVRLAQPELNAEFQFEDQGLHRLKDLGQPVRLFLLRHSALSQTVARPLRTLEALPHNFPAQVTSFVGRTREIAELMEMLRQGTSRILTVTGPGGTGKTRLAMQVAADRLQDYPDGVWFVDLAPTRDPRAVPAAVALALKLDLAAGADPAHQLSGFLRDRRCLLVLDNFEQVADAAPLLSGLIRDCPGLTILVTSRELLHVGGERGYEVQPLTVPNGEGPEDWAKFDSVQLFIERCQTLRPDFNLTAETGPVVAEICRRLDGIPLAIELAAARTRGMSPQQILQRLSHRFDLLASGQRDVPERQRALRRTIDWSYDLLSEPERECFAELAIFAGGFFMEAAEEICTLPGSLDLVFSLRDKSLLKVDEVNGDPRYSMLEMLREYAQERLQQSGRADMIGDRHAAYFLTQAQRWNEGLGGPGHDEAMQNLTVDIANLRAGMDWTRDHGPNESLVEYGKSLARFLRTRGLYDESVYRVSAAEEAARRTGDHKSLARLLNHRGLAAWERYDLRAARPLFEESQAINRALNDKPRMAVASANLGNILWGYGDYEQAREIWEEGFRLAVEIDDLRLQGVISANLGILACARGEFESAEENFGRSVAFHESNQDFEGVASSLYNSSESAAKQKNFSLALERLNRSRQLYVRNGNRYGMALTLARMSQVLSESGRPGDGIADAEECLKIATEIGSQSCFMYGYHAMALALDLLGDIGRAEEMYRKSFEVGDSVGDGRHMADVLKHYGELLFRLGRTDRAYVLLAVAAKEYHARGMIDEDEVVAQLDQVRANLSEIDATILDGLSAALSPREALART